jgi:hypothetical protein
MMPPTPSISKISCRLAEGYDLIDVDAAIFLPRRGIRRHRPAKTPRRNALDIGRGCRITEGLEQNAGVACRSLVRIKAADYGFDCLDRAAHLPQVADQRRGDEGFPDFCSGAGDEDRGHRISALTKPAAARFRQAARCPHRHAGR